MIYASKMQKKVLAFREELSMWLLFHRMNRKNPDLIQKLNPDPILLDQDSSDNEDSDDNGQNATLIPTESSGQSLKASGEKEDSSDKEDCDDNGEKQQNVVSPKASGEKLVQSLKGSGGKQDISRSSTEEDRITSTSQTEDNDDDSVLSPTQRGRRRKLRNVTLTAPVNFDDDRTVKVTTCVEVYNVVKEKW
jgi:hypothetical protein